VDLGRDVYQLCRLIVLRPQAISGAPFRGERFAVLAYSSASTGFSPLVYRGVQPPSDRDPTLGGFSAHTGTSGVTARNFWRQPGTRFEIVAGQRNEWKIPIPDELAQAVRTALKADQESKDKPAAKADASSGGR
jgi:hypothetical protein